MPSNGLLLPQDLQSPGELEVPDNLNQTSREKLKLQDHPYLEDHKNLLPPTVLKARLGSAELLVSRVFSSDIF